MGRGLTEVVEVCYAKGWERESREESQKKGKDRIEGFRLIYYFF